MTYFFGMSRHQDNGLSDATNLLSTRSMKREQPTSLQFSARRLLCFAGGGAADRSIGEMESPIQKFLSPSPEVATAWMEMEATSHKSSSSPTPLTERSSVTPPSRDGSITTQPASSRRNPYCGARRMPEPDVHPRPQRSSRSRNPANAVTKHQHNHKRWTAKRMGQWKSAVDPKSGRTYYYNERTRETQWRKPLELASPAERKEMALKEGKQKEFFAAMERNILRNIAQGQVAGAPVEDKKVPSAGSPSCSGGALEKPRMVRTISGMNDSILRELVKRVPSTRTTKMPREESLDIDDLMMMMMKEDLTVLKESGSNVSMLPKDTGWADLDFDMNDDDDSSPSAREESRVLQELAKTAEQMTLVSGSAIVTPDDPMMPKPKSLGLERPALEKPFLGGRRNTCGTIYVGTTMSAPDKDATIKCVCGVYRAHILSEDSFPTRLDDAKYRIFNDHEADRITFIREDVEMEDAPSHIPSLEEITNFYRDVFRRAQMESDTIIMSLIYVERLIKVTNGGLRPTRKNWRSLLFSCMVLSSKVWDDLSMWNADFSQTCPSRVKFSLRRINELELAVLGALSYEVRVPASEYAKYYFLLRSMLIKSGLGGDDLKTMNPLDVEGAKQLEQVSSNFQATAATKRRVAQQDKLRSKSMGHVDSHDASQGQDKKASLEHMVKM